MLHNRPQKIQKTTVKRMGSSPSVFCCVLFAGWAVWQWIFEGKYAIMTFQNAFALEGRIDGQYLSAIEERLGKNHVTDF